MELKDKIKRLTNAYGVSGDEFRVSEIAAELLKPYVDKVGIDRFGNVTGYKSCGVPGAKKLLLDAHIDQIGFMITEVTDGGFLRFIGMLNVFELQEKLVACALPSGFESRQAKVLAELAKPYVDEVTIDTLGNVICHKKGPGKKLMMPAHMSV